MKIAQLRHRKAVKFHRKSLQHNFHPFQPGMIWLNKSPVDGNAETGGCGSPGSALEELASRECKLSQAEYLENRVLKAGFLNDLFFTV